MRLGQVSGHFIFVCPPWTYTENVVEIHQDLTEIGRFICICFNWVGMVMIGHDHLGKVKQGLV